MRPMISIVDRRVANLAFNYREWHEQDTKAVHHSSHRSPRKVRKIPFLYKEH